MSSKLFTDYMILANYYEKIGMPKIIGLKNSVYIKNEARALYT